MNSNSHKYIKLSAAKFIFSKCPKTDMKVLFICNQNQNRSKTAEEMFKAKFETKSAGLYNKKPVSNKELSWADLVIVMENEQKSEIAKRFPEQYLQKRILSLDIPDIYHYNQPGLIKALTSKMDKLGLP